MSAEHPASGRSRRVDVMTASGIAILVALMLAMVMHHPVAGQTEAGAIVGSIADQAGAIRVVHGTVAAAMATMTSLMLSFAMRLGLARPHVLLGAVSSALALVLICLAVLLDGFVAPALAVRCMAIGQECAVQTLALLRYGALQIEFMTRFGLIAFAGATALWAGDLILREDSARTAGALGLFSAFTQLAILFVGDERLNAHSLALIVAAQAIWYVSVGGVIVFRQGPYAAAQRA